MNVVGASQLAAAACLLGDLVRLDLLQQRLGLRVVLEMVAHLAGAQRRRREGRGAGCSVRKEGEEHGRTERCGRTAAAAAMPEPLAGAPQLVGLLLQQLPVGRCSCWNRNEFPTAGPTITFLTGCRMALRCLASAGLRSAGCSAPLS